jgi:hypothetical protein
MPFYMYYRVSKNQAVRTNVPLIISFDIIYKRTKNLNLASQEPMEREKGNGTSCIMRLF